MGSGTNIIRPTDHRDLEIILNEPRLVQRGPQGLDIDGQAGPKALEALEVGQLTRPQDVHCSIWS